LLVGVVILQLEVEGVHNTGAEGDKYCKGREEFLLYDEHILIVRALLTECNDVHEQGAKNVIYSSGFAVSSVVEDNTENGKRKANGFDCSEYQPDEDQNMLFLHLIRVYDSLSKERGCVKQIIYITYP